eukprot:6208506-Pleurochrysis_carterae.AAC.2
MQNARAELDDIFVKPTTKQRRAGKDREDSGDTPATNKRRLSSSTSGAEHNVNTTKLAQEEAGVRGAEPKRKRASTNGADSHGSERRHGHNSWRTPQPPPPLSALADSLAAAGLGSLSGSVTESVAGSVGSDRRRSGNGVASKRRESDGTPAAAKRARVSSGLSTASERGSGEKGTSGTKGILRDTSLHGLSSGKPGKNSPQSGGIGSDSKDRAPKAEHRNETTARASIGVPRIGEEVCSAPPVQGSSWHCRSVHAFRLG